MLCGVGLAVNFGFFPLGDVFLPLDEVLDLVADLLLVEVADFEDFCVPVFEVEGVCFVELAGVLWPKPQSGNATARARQHSAAS